jgi:hypothetical protein
LKRERSSALVEAVVYIVIRKFNHITSVADAARRAESGIGQLLKLSPEAEGVHEVAGPGPEDSSECPVI